MAPQPGCLAGRRRSLSRPPGLEAQVLAAMPDAMEFSPAQIQARAEVEQRHRITLWCFLTPAPGQPGQRRGASQGRWSGLEP